MFHLPIVEIVVSIILTVLVVGGLPGLVGLMAVESFGFPPLPSEVILLFAGFLVATGQFNFAAAFAAGLLGGVIGSVVAYVVGRDARGWLFPAGRRPRIPLDQRALDRMDRWFARHGEGTVALGRLLPVVRSYISYPAGAARMGVGKFVVFTAVGATPFTLALLVAGYELGANWRSILPYFSILDDVAILAIGVGIVYLGGRWVLARRAARARVTPSTGAPPPGATPPP